MPAALVLLFLIYNLIAVQSYFVIPKLHFAMLEPKGFSVCMPDQKGLTRFSFHWNLNKPLGQWSDGDHYSDVVTAHRNMWCYVDSSVSLKIGDRIFYWVEVEVHKFGYRMENQLYEVTSSMHHDIFANANNGTPLPPFTPLSKEEFDAEVMFYGGDCSLYPHDINLTQTERLNHHSCQLQTHSFQIADLEKKNEELRDKMDYIEQLTSLFLVQIESCNSTLKKSNTLLLVGFLPATVSPLHLLNEIVHVQLGFGYKEMTVEQAYRKYDNTIEFRMNNFKSKVRVFVAGKSKLKGSQYQIKDIT